eukprot:3911532-Prymnesium_polylepis.1
MAMLRAHPAADIECCIPSNVPMTCRAPVSIRRAHWFDLCCLLVVVSRYTPSTVPRAPCASRSEVASKASHNGSGRAAREEGCAAEKQTEARSASFTTRRPTARQSCSPSRYTWSTRSRTDSTDGPSATVAEPQRLYSRAQKLAHTRSTGTEKPPMRSSGNSSS